MPSRGRYIQVGPQAPAPVVGGNTRPPAQPVVMGQQGQNQTISIPGMNAPTPASAPAPSQGGGQAQQIAAPTPFALPSSTVNTAQPNPEQMEYLRRIRERLDNPGNDERALNQAGQAIQQFAEGERGQTRGDFARRGVLGNAGSEQGAMTEIGNRAQGNFGRAAESIAIQRMRDNDAMLQGAQGAFAEPGRQALADRGLGIQQRGQDLSAQLQGRGQDISVQIANQGAAQQANQLNLQAQIAAQEAARQQQAMVLAQYNSIYR